MNRPIPRLVVFVCAQVLFEAAAAAQGGSLGPHITPSATTSSDSPAPPPAPSADLPATSPPPAPSADVARTLAAPAATVTPGLLTDLSSALGFGVGVIPSTQLAGTTGAVSLKYWASDHIAVAPLFSFAYSKPSDSDAAWRVRPEVIVLFVPIAGRSTLFEIGGGIGFEIRRPAPSPDVSGMLVTPDTILTVAVPVQAGVEHFFTRWFSLGIAARSDLVAYTHDGGYHEFSMSLDSTSLLGQLFLYTD